MIAYISHLFSLVYFAPVGLYIVLFLMFFCNKLDIWWLHTSTENKIKIKNIFFF